MYQFKLYQNVLGADCKVTDPINNYTFDMSQLRTEHMHTVLVDGAHNEFIDFNVCGVLFKPCNKLSHSSACYTKDGVEKIIGKYLNFWKIGIRSLPK